MEMPSVLLLVVGAFVLGAVLVWLLRRAFGSGGRLEPKMEMRADLIAERVRAVGRLVGLEVRAKEIATVTKGWSWMPPLILSQARLAMIFNFEKQYSVDLAAIGPADVEKSADGRYRVRMPKVHGSLRLTDVTPYDIQDGRILGLLDVIQMNAKVQEQLMKKAQEQAAGLFVQNDDRYLTEARLSVEKQLSSLLALFDAEVELDWGLGDEVADEMVAVGKAAQALTGAA